MFKRAKPSLVSSECSQGVGIRGSRWHGYTTTTVDTWRWTAWETSSVMGIARWPRNVAILRGLRTPPRVRAQGSVSWLRSAAARNKGDSKCPRHHSLGPDPSGRPCRPTRCGAEYCSRLLRGLEEPRDGRRRRGSGSISTQTQDRSTLLTLRAAWRVASLAADAMQSFFLGPAIIGH